MSTHRGISRGCFVLEDYDVYMQRQNSTYFCGPPKYTLAVPALVEEQITSAFRNYLYTHRSDEMSDPPIEVVLGYYNSTSHPGHARKSFTLLVNDVIPRYSAPDPNLLPTGEEYSSIPDDRTTYTTSPTNKIEQPAEDTFTEGYPQVQEAGTGTRPKDHTVMTLKERLDGLIDPTPITGAPMSVSMYAFDHQKTPTRLHCPLPGQIAGPLFDVLTWDKVFAQTRHSDLENGPYHGRRNYISTMLLSGRLTNSEPDLSLNSPGDTLTRPYRWSELQRTAASQLMCITRIPMRLVYLRKAENLCILQLLRAKTGLLPVRLDGNQHALGKDVVDVAFLHPILCKHGMEDLGITGYGVMDRGLRGGYLPGRDTASVTETSDPSFRTYHTAERTDRSIGPSKLRQVVSVISDEQSNASSNATEPEDGKAKSKGKGKAKGKMRLEMKVGRKGKAKIDVNGKGKGKGKAKYEVKTEVKDESGDEEPVDHILGLLKYVTKVEDTSPIARERRSCGPYEARWRAALGESFARLPSWEVGEGRHLRKTQATTPASNGPIADLTGSGTVSNPVLGGETTRKQFLDLSDKMEFIVPGDTSPWAEDLIEQFSHLKIKRLPSEDAKMNVSSRDQDVETTKTRDASSPDINTHDPSEESSVSRASKKIREIEAWLSESHGTDAGEGPSRIEHAYDHGIELGPLNSRGGTARETPPGQYAIWAGGRDTGLELKADPIKNPWGW